MERIEAIDKETLAARDSLRTSVYEFCASRGVDADKVFSNGVGVQIKMIFEDAARHEIPNVLSDFVQNQYPSRTVGIKEIEVGYREVKPGRGLAIFSSKKGISTITIGVSHLYPHSDDEVVNETRRIVIDEDENTGLKTTESLSKMEIDTDYDYFVIPEKQLILCNLVCLVPSRYPMDFGITAYSLDEWVKSYVEWKKEESASERLERQLSVINRIVDPHNIGILERKRFRIPFLSNTIEGGVLLSEVVESIASIIPDLPRNKSTRKDIFGYNLPIPQPYKQLAIL